MARYYFEAMCVKQKLCTLLLASLSTLPLRSPAPASHQDQIAAHSRLAQQYLNERRPDLAIPEFQALVSLEPRNLDAQGNLGVLLFFQGDYVKAEPHLRAALEMQPNLTKIQTLLGMAEKRTGDTTKAADRPINRHGKMASARLSAAAVADIVKRYVAAVGLDATEFAGHSLRSGLATSAAAAGASERSIMNQTGHRSVQMVRRYIRDGNLCPDNSGGKLGL